MFSFWKLLSSIDLVLDTAAPILDATDQTLGTTDWEQPTSFVTLYVEFPSQKSICDITLNWL